MTAKICKLCGSEKDVSHFYRNKNYSDGLDNRCNECRSAIQKAWYVLPENKAKRREQERKSRSSPGGRRASYERYKRWASTENGKASRRRNAAKSRKRHKNKSAAHTAIFYAVKCGLIIPPKDCDWCHHPLSETNPLEAHHWKGYETPKDWVDVKWVHRYPCHPDVEHLTPDQWPMDNIH